jgi:histidinol-phosphatase
MLVAEGRLDFAIEAFVNLWDLAAVQPIVEEAGGRFSDFSGLARPDGGSGLSSNGLLHDEVLRVLASESHDAGGDKESQSRPDRATPE